MLADTNDHLAVSLAALRLGVVVGRLLTVRYLTALLPKGTAGGTAGSFMTSLPCRTITYATSRRTPSLRVPLFVTEN